MNKVWATGFAVLLGASMFWASAMPAWAGEGNMAGFACPVDLAYSRSSVNNAYLGARILDRHGEELGTVADVTVDSQGMVNFLVVSMCLPGMTDQLVGIPYSATDAQQPVSVGTVTVYFSKEQIASAPTFSREWRPSNWAQRDYEYFENIS